MKRLILFALVCSACGSSPTAPSVPTAPIRPVPPSTPQPITITGHVTATNGGQPLAGVSAALGTTTATTDGSGSFSASMLPTASLSLALTGNSIVPRTIRVAANNTRDMNADAIMLGSGFDLNFYRQLVRDGHDNPSANYALRRWTTAPRIYVKTVDEAGEPIHGPTLDMVESTARDIIPKWTAGVFGVAEIQRGTESREGQSGWITIKWPSVADPNHCGQADIAKDGGIVELQYHNPRCRCAATVIPPTTVRHELGHAMGFFHTDGADVMNPSGYPCDLQPSARELYHARIAYSRPVGNSDPDNDSTTGVVNLAPLRVP